MIRRLPRLDYQDTRVTDMIELYLGIIVPREMQAEGYLSQVNYVTLS